MKKLQQEYIYQAEDKMANVEVVTGPDGTILGLREDANLEPMFPSTEELFDFVNDPEKYQHIKALQDECMQKADEKVAVARQALELIDAKVQRLDHDLSAMETLLQVGVVAEGRHPPRPLSCVPTALVSQHLCLFFRQRESFNQGWLPRSMISRHVRSLRDRNGFWPKCCIMI